MHAQRRRRPGDAAMGGERLADHFESRLVHGCRRRHARRAHGKARDGMEVRVSTPEVLKARQYVLAIINANHSDRCLTCHRRVKCMPGDVCLRDDVVTHRCLTCSKNYRCGLQTTNELLKLG